MARYNYDKKVLKGLGVGPFLGEVKTREAEIAKAGDEMPRVEYNPNVIARKLHPSVQFGVIERVIPDAGAKTYIIGPDTKKGTQKLAFFRAGQYISIAMDIGKARMCKPYTLCSAPETALKQGRYAITVKETKDGYASKYILETWAPGTEIILSAPLGEFYYVSLRDAPSVVALAGGSGITPFLAMARAIADGTESFNLTVLYGSRTEDSILLKNELAEAERKAGGKVKVVHVLSDEDKPGFEHGFITAELIRKYAPAAYSVFVCGPKAMYAFAEKEIASLGLPRRLVRFELSGEFGAPSQDPAWPKENAGRVFNVSVLVRGERTEVTCKAEQTLLSAMETAGIRVPSDCRSGECGWCHSRLISGRVFVPEKADGRRAGDKKFGWVHPCAAYPLSDIEIEVFPMLGE